MVLGDFRDFLKNDRTPFFEAKRRVNEGNFAQKHFFPWKIPCTTKKKNNSKKFKVFKL